MSTNIQIANLQNENVRQIAIAIDESGVSKVDGLLDEKELTIFAEKVKDLTQKDWTELVGLFKTDGVEKNKRAELSWNEIGNSALNSTKKFFKGMFCDEEGFSIKRTATTVGVIGGLALAAPVAAALGAGTAVVGAVATTTKLLGLGLTGFMLYNGGKNVVEGTQAYYKSTSQEEAKAAMDKTMDGAVEATMALPAAVGFVKAANKGIRMSQTKKAKLTETQQPTEAPKPIEPQKPLEAPAPKFEQHANYTKKTTYHPNGKEATVEVNYYDGAKAVDTYYDNGRRATHSWKNTKGEYEEATYFADGRYGWKSHESYYIADDGTSVRRTSRDNSITRTREYYKEENFDNKGKRTDYLEEKCQYDDHGKILETTTKTDGKYTYITRRYENDMVCYEERIPRIFEISKEVIRYNREGKVISAYRHYRNGEVSSFTEYGRASEFRYR